MGKDEVLLENCLQDVREGDKPFRKCIICLLETMAYTGDVFFGSSHVRKARWNFIRLCTYVLEFEFRVRVMDYDALVRLYAAEKLGSLLCGRGFIIIHALLHGNAEKGDMIDTEAFTINQFFDIVDNLLNKFCGVTQSQLSCTARMTRNTNTLTSSSGFDGMDIILSRQISGIRVIRSLCQNTIPEIKDGSSFVEKGVDEAYTALDRQFQQIRGLLFLRI